MQGVFQGAIAGIVFGLYQTANRRASYHLTSVLSTFLLILTASLFLALVVAATGGLADLRFLTFRAVIYLGLAGFIHFTLGWTFVSFSQKAIGAARTGALVGTAPLFGVMLDIVIYREWPSILTLGAIATVVVGVFLVSHRGAEIAATPRAERASWLDRKQSYLWGLLVALCWALSPIFIRQGLAALPSPTLGIALSLAMGAVFHSLILAARHRQIDVRGINRTAVLYQIMAGLFSGAGTWMYWSALTTTPVGVVLALSRLSVPVVLLLSPFIARSEVDRPTPAVWVGAGLIVAGSIGLIWLS
jgi:drug/metabolite transporter (DMT)-like permease